MTWSDPSVAIPLFQTGDVFTEGNFKTYVLDNLLAVSHPYDFSSGDVDVNTTTTETSLWSKLITGADMGSNGMLRLLIEGDYLYNNSASDTIRLRVKFGGASVIDFGTAAPSGATNASRWPWELDVRLYNEAATNVQLVTAKVFGRYGASTAITTGIGYIGPTQSAASGSLVGMGQNTAAVDTTADQTFQVTAQWSASSANLSWRKRLAVLTLGQELNLFDTGTLLRRPGGNVENVDVQKANGVKWAALNIGVDVGYDPTVWNYQRTLYRGIAMPHAPWMHCRSLGDIDTVLSVAKVWDSPFVGVNIEDVVSDNLSLKAVGAVLTASGLPVHMPTLPWVQNGQGWNYVSDCVLALEMFPLEGDGQKYLDEWEKCVDHAFKEGAKKVTLLYSTTSPRSKYPNVAHCLYTADNVTDWSAWKDSVPQPVPKPPEVPPVALTPNQKKELRQQLVRFSLVAEKYEKVWHYTQARPYTGLGTPFSSTHHNDCSSYLALLYYSASRAAGFGIHDPLDYHYAGYGNTQSAYEFLKDHRAPLDKYRIGDIALYGSRSDTVHVTMCRKAGTGQTAVWTSFGQEAGPEARQPVSYHPSPLVGVYRHPALL